MPARVRISLIKIGAGTGTIDVLAFSPDGSFPAAGGEDGNVSLWAVATMKIGSPLAVNHNSIFGIAFSPDAPS